jgi:hypothetical protein
MQAQHHKCIGDAVTWMEPENHGRRTGTIHYLRLVLHITMQKKSHSTPNRDTVGSTTKPRQVRPFLIILQFCL